MTSAPTSPTPDDVGVLLTNLGTPDAPTTRAVRRYLAQFLWDVRVVDAPRWLWWMILHLVILRIRPSRSAKLYQRVWTDEGSPLLVISQRQRARLEQSLAERHGRTVPVERGMRYGNPSIASGIDALMARGIRRIVVLPAYPQYAASTVASTFDAVGLHLQTLRHIPEIRFVNGYHVHPGYIGALADSVREAVTDHRDRRLLLSFHGIPKRYAELGDPDRVQGEETAAALAERLELAPGQWDLSFQSRVGREEWLKPYTDDLLEEWAAEGINEVHVACPGFSADCLETVDEIARESNEAFVEAGGKALHYLPALNDTPAHVKALADIVDEHAAGWLPTVAR